MGACVGYARKAAASPTGSKSEPTLVKDALHAPDSAATYPASDLCRVRGGNHCRAAIRARSEGLQGLVLPSPSAPPGVQPLLVTPAALYRLLDEVNTPCAFIDGGEIPGQPIGFDLLSLSAYRRNDVHINIGECLNEPFRMSRGQSRRLLGLLAEVVVAPLEYPFRLLSGSVV